MPTSTDEAATIQGIINEFLSPEQAKEITLRLDSEVGSITDNDSLKVSLQMLRELYDVKEMLPTRTQKTMLFAVIASHMIILAIDLVAIFVLPFIAPWYIAVPIITLIVNLMFSPVSCPLTRLECRMRRSMNYPEVRFFIKYYLLDPIRRRNSRRAQPA